MDARYLLGCGWDYWGAVGNANFAEVIPANGELAVSIAVAGDGCLYDRQRSSGSRLKKILCERVSVRVASGQEIAEEMAKPQRLGLWVEEIKARD